LTLEFFRIIASLIAAWVAEVGSIMVGGQPWQKMGMVAQACYPSYSRKHKRGGPVSTSLWAKSKTLSHK
jgi:hypothetical protein